MTLMWGYYFFNFCVAKLGCTSKPRRFAHEITKKSKIEHFLCEYNMKNNLILLKTVSLCAIAPFAGAWIEIEEYHKQNNKQQYRTLRGCVD